MFSGHNIFFCFFLLPENKFCCLSPTKLLTDYVITKVSPPVHIAPDDYNINVCKFSFGWHERWQSPSDAYQNDITDHEEGKATANAATLAYEP